MLAPAFLALVCTPSSADPTLGFVETWAGGVTHRWFTQATLTNPGSGGVDGATDGFLRIQRTTPDHLGAASSGPEYTGNWTAAGIREIRLQLSDLGTDDHLEIHVAVGGFNDLWQYNPGFVPPLDGWTEFDVDLTDSTKFTHIIALDGTGFAAALENVQVLHVRHDLAPYLRAPDSAIGDFGLDNVTLTQPGFVPALPSTWGRIKAMYRERP